MNVLTFCWPTCTLGRWTFVPLNPIGLLVWDQVVMEPVQHKQARTDPIHQLTEDPNTGPQFAVVSDFPQVGIMFYLDIEKHTPLPCEMLHQSVISLDLCTCEFWRRPMLSSTTIKLETCHIFQPPLFKPCICNLHIDSCHSLGSLVFCSSLSSSCKQCWPRMSMMSGINRGGGELWSLEKRVGRGLYMFRGHVHECSSL